MINNGENEEIQKLRERVESLNNQVRELENSSPYNQRMSQWLINLGHLHSTKEGRKSRNLLLLVLIILAVTTGFVAYFLRPQTIEITKEGSIYAELRNTKKGVFQLSPNGGNKNINKDEAKEYGPWVKTGITVQKGVQIEIRASGRINTAIKRVVARTIKPEIKEQPWVYPKGQTTSEDESKRLKNLDKYKLQPDAEFGTLLAAVTTSPKVKRESIEKFPSDSEILEFTAAEDGELVLSVNDIWLNYYDEPDYRKAYVQPYKDNLEYYLQTAKFDAAFQDKDLTPLTEALEFVETLTETLTGTVKETLAEAAKETNKKELIETLKELDDKKLTRESEAETVNRLATILLEIAEQESTIEVRNNAESRKELKSKLDEIELEEFATALMKAYEQYLKRDKDWNKIEKEEYWNIWYEDNIGSFNVSIEIKEKPWWSFGFIKSLNPFSNGDNE